MSRAWIENTPSLPATAPLRPVSCVDAWRANEWPPDVSPIRISVLNPSSDPKIGSSISFTNVR